MQSVSQGFTNACKAIGREPVDYIEFNWSGKRQVGGRGASGWVNESSYLIDANGTIRLNAPGLELIRAGDLATVNITLDNSTGRFSWRSPDSPLHSLAPAASGFLGTAVRIWQGFKVNGTPEYVCIFTGFVTSWNEDHGAGTIRLTCKDWGWQYVQNKIASPVYANQAPEDWISTVGQMGGMLESDMVLDKGIHVIPFTWLDDESVAEEIWETARADGGVAYFDQLGKLHFENLLHWASHNASVWTFTANDYQQNVIEYSSDDLVTKVILEWSGRQIGAPIVVYNLDQPRTILPGQSDWWRARFDHPVITPDGIASHALITPNWKAPYRDWVAMSGGGVSMTSKLTIALSDVYGQQCKITVTNTDTKLSATLIKLQLRGYPLVGRPAEQVEALASPAPLPYERIRSERGNVYVQTHSQAQGLVSYLAAKNAKVRATYTLKGAACVPHLELGDRVTITDGKAFGETTNGPNSRDGYVISINWPISVNMAGVADYTVLDAESLWAYDDYFIIGLTALGQHGRCIY